MTFSFRRLRRVDNLARRPQRRRRQMAVEALETRQLLATFFVTSNADSGSGSLRQAISNSDVLSSTVANPNFISFSELKNVTQIQLLSPLPTITQPVIIDGTTEGSYNGNHPFVQLLGNTAGSAFGLDITASGTQVKALAIDAFSAGGVLIDNASNVTLSGDYIGLDPNMNASGNDANQNPVYEGNGVYGVTIQSENGGTATSDLLSNDVVSANMYNGIILSGSGTTKNVVSGTIIGSDATGAAVVDDPGNALGNGQVGGGGSGVVINGGASLNTIGGTTVASRDVIVGNKSYGVLITDGGTSQNVVEGDVIGTDITGMHAVDSVGRSYGNGLDGVAILSNAHSNLISGTPSAPEVISGNAEDGVLISGGSTSENLIEGVHIGTDITGEVALPNGGDGVAVTNGASANSIGSRLGSPNIISGNSGNGVSLTGSGTDTNFVENSLIGIDAGGIASLGNAKDGVLIGTQASDNYIGYPFSSAGNVISGNNTWGVYITDSGTSDNTVENNFIGTNVTGTYPVPNANNGVDIVYGATSNTIGGTTAASRNLISGNLHEGVLIGFAGTSQNVVEGNSIGTDVTGKAFLVSQQQTDGVYVGLGAGSNTIGGQNPLDALDTAAWNVISGNSDSGILVTDSGTSGTVISGNFIGTDVTGLAALPNGANGITIAAGTSSTIVGAGTSVLPNLNVISGNLGDGVSITSSSGDDVNFNYIGVDLNNQNALPNRGNGVSIHAASGNGVSLDVIRNNAGFGILTDTGANHNAWYYDSIFGNASGGIAQPSNPSPQPAPDLTGVSVANGQTTITGMIFASPYHNASLVLQFYASPASTAPASIQGLKFIGQATATTDGNGNATFTSILNTATPAGQIITATADFGVNSTSNFSNAVTVPLTSSATFLGTDTTDQGNWRNDFGADGYDIAADTSATNPKLPSYATLSLTGGTSYVWAASTTDARALQNAANTGRIASTWYTSTTMSFNLNLTDGKTHEVSLYAVDFVNSNRSEQVQVIDAATGTVLNTQTLSSFQKGAYLSWNLSGNVVIKVTNLNSASNAVVSGLFFGGAPTSTATTATFLGTDTTTEGSWHGVYGTDGYDLAQDTSSSNPKIPAYATLALTGATGYTWAANTTDARALQNAANTGRIAATWYSSTTMSFNLNLTDGKVHKISLYAVDYVNSNRSEQIQIIDNATGTVLDTQSLTSFQNGKYLSWDVSGSVTIKVTNENPASNAVVSGIFFG